LLKEGKTDAEELFYGPSEYNEIEMGLQEPPGADELTIPNRNRRKEWNGRGDL
jgi:hypothetical protein